MISDAILVKIACADAYDPAAQWDKSWNVEGVEFHARIVDGVKVIAFPGSHDDLDWTRDFTAIPIYHPVLGWVHLGFSEGIDQAVVEIANYVGKDPWIPTGHSLGGARSMDAAALMIVAGIPPAQISAFGCPRPGFAKEAGIINAGCDATHVYHNRKDPVSDVPWLGGLFVTPGTIIQTEIDPGRGPRNFTDHMGANYIEGVTKLWCPAPPSV